MTDDIVVRVIAWSTWLDERCPETDVGNDLREAADEIERLRAERDELLSQRNQLRAEVVDRALRINHPVCWNINSPTRKRCEKYARLRGWHDLWDTVNEQERLLREEASR